MKLPNARLSLRPIVEGDLESIFKGLSHPDVIRHYGVSFQSLEATRGQMNWYAQLERDGTGIWWAICSRDDAFLGAIGVNGIVKAHRKGELGFWLLPEHWGRGYISEAMPLVLDHGFGRLGLHRLEAQVETDNIASRKVLERCGFAHEGTLRECEVKNGRFVSLDVFSCLAP